MLFAPRPPFKPRTLVPRVPSRGDPFSPHFYVMSHRSKKFFSRSRNARSKTRSSRNSSSSYYRLSYSTGLNHKWWGLFLCRSRFQGQKGAWEGGRRPGRYAFSSHGKCGLCRMGRGYLSSRPTNTHCCSDHYRSSSNPHYANTSESGLNSFSNCGW